MKEVSTTTTTNLSSSSDFGVLGDDEQQQQQQQETTTKINVGGTIFCVTTEMILRHPHTMLGAMLSRRWQHKHQQQQQQKQGGVNDDDANDGDIGDNNNNKKEFHHYLDRDPTRFRYILDYYRDGGKIIIPMTISKSEMMREVEYFALPLTEDDIQYDAKDIGDVRQSLLRFDTHAVDALKREAHNRAVIACAYELASLLIDKAMKNGHLETFCLTKGEVPVTSFAHVMCPKVLTESNFQQTIRDLVRRAGYDMVGMIDEDNFVMKRCGFLP